MNRARLSFAAFAAAAVSTLVLPAAGAGASETVQAAYNMSEASGARVMNDSGPYNLDGVIDADAASAGLTMKGSYYHWDRKPPNEAPAEPARVVKVPDNDHLDPLDDTFTVEFRFRTVENFGNIIQKGQSTTRGGQWKVQNPQGRPSCLFKGSQGRVTARSPKALNNGAWHVLKCVRTSTSVTMFVDGQQVSRNSGATGIINNSVNFSIGGKTNCDQTKVTCDYYSGDIDYVWISRG